MGREKWYWATILELISEHDFQIIEAPQAKEEFRNEANQTHPNVYLMRNRGRRFEIVRLQYLDFAWNSVITRDIRQIADHIERFRKSVKASFLTIHNFYILPCPLDDFFETNKELLELEEKKTKLLTKAGYFPEESIFIDEPFLQASNLGLDVSALALDSNAFRQRLTAIVQTMTIDQIKHSIAYVEKKKEQQFNQIFFFGKPIFTYLFIFINILMFLYVEIGLGSSQNVQNLITMGAKSNEHIMAGEYWRLVTPIFLHIGFLHITFNSIALYFLGSVVERIYGSSRFLVIYLIAGIMGTVASFAFTPNISAGASGSIFGCFGALLYFGLKHRNLFFRTMGTDIIFILFFNLGIGFIVPMIDNYGHIGGLIGGFLASMLLSLPRTKMRKNAISIERGAALLILGLMISFCWMVGFGLL